MFRKNKGEGDQPETEQEADMAEDDINAPPLKPFSRKGTHTPPKQPSAGSFRPDIPRRAPDIPGIPRRTDVTARRGNEDDPKRLTVGRDICLSGEITSCDRLVVEGTVEARLTDARIIEVAPTGFFKGAAEVQEADISGRYDGELIARDKLTVRAGGRITGTVRYGRIVIESGGEISGDMQTLNTDDKSR